MGNPRKRRGTQKNCGKGASRQLTGAKAKHAWMRQAFLMCFVHPLVDPIKYAPLTATKPSPDDSSKYIKKVESTKKNESLVNLLTTSADVMTFLNGRPIDYSQLVPQIQIYKVYVKNKKEVGEVLLPFQSTTDFQQWKDNAGADGSLFRGREAGIQDVQIKMDGRGRNPVSANVMHLTIKYFFNDVKTLFAPLDIDPFSAKSQNAKLNAVTYSDLIRYPPSTLDVDSSPTSLDASFRIRLIMGWSVNEENSILDPAFSKAAKDAKINFIGDLFTHQLDFREDGSLVITAEYKGALETAFASTAANILHNINLDESNTLAGIKAELNKVEATEWASVKITGAGKRKKISEITTALETLKRYSDARDAFKQILKKSPYPAEIVKNYNKALGGYQKAFSNASFLKGKAGKKLLDAAKSLKIDVYPKKNEKLDKQTKIALEKERKAQVGNKQKLKKILDKINKRKQQLGAQINAVEASIKSGHLFGYVLDLMDKNMVAYVYTDKKSAYANWVRLRTYYESGEFTKEGALEKTNKLLGVLRKEKSKTTEPPAKGDPKATAQGKKGKKSGSSSQQATQLLRTGEYKGGDKIFFFRLGDLLSVIFDKGQFGANLENLCPDFKILLGQYYFYNIDASDRGGTESTSLYDLPISLEIFNAFISQRVVGSGRSNYPLIAFIWDLIKFVMDKTMSSFGKARSGADNPFIDPINFKLDMTAVDLLKVDLEGGGALSVSDNKNINTVKIQKTPINQISNTFLFHAHGGPFNKRIQIERRANIAEDANDGIVHFYVGGPNRGILKSIKFQETKNTLFSTALMRNGQNGGLDSGRGVIRPTKFNCEVVLVGNPYFYIGQMFYVNSELISSGHFRAEKIMNGGYYIVTAVESRLSANGWETRIRGVMNIPDTNLKFSQIHMPVRPLRTLSGENMQKILDMQPSLNQASNATSNVPKTATTTNPPPKTKTDKKGKAAPSKSEKDPKAHAAEIPITVDHFARGAGGHDARGAGAYGEETDWEETGIPERWKKYFSKQQ